MERQTVSLSWRRKNRYKEGCVAAAMTKVRVKGQGQKQSSVLVNVIWRICIPNISTVALAGCEYHNDPKFSEKRVWANTVDPDQTAPRVCTVPHSVCIFWTHYSKVKPLC